MKKNILMVTCYVVPLLISSIAYSAEGPYISAHLGLASVTDLNLSDYSGTASFNFNHGVASSGAVGYDFGNIRIESEISHQKNNYDKLNPGGINIGGDATSKAFLVNGYYDFKNNISHITTFISAGIGAARVNMSSSAQGNVAGTSDTAFAYQIGAGFSFAVNETLSLDLKYRFFSTSYLNFKGSEGKFLSHNVYAGVRASF